MLQEVQDACYPEELPLNKCTPGLSSAVTQNACSVASAEMDAARVLVVRP